MRKSTEEKYDAISYLQAECIALWYSTHTISLAALVRVFDITLLKHTCPTRWRLELP